MADPFSRLADQQAAAQGQLTDRTLQLLGRLWAQVTNPADPGQLAVFVQRASTVLRSAEQATGRVTETYLRQVLRQMGVTVPAGQLVALPDSLRNGVPPAEVLQRPAETVRYLTSVDAPRDAATTAGLARLNAIAATNLQLALRQSTVDVLSKVEGTKGYRRILRPYLSQGGSCGLCIAAADRIYHSRELMPIHANCKCAVLPVTRFGDPGLRLNTDDLDQLYATAGATEAARLKRVRYAVEEHGELGPILVVQGQHYRSVDAAARATRAAGRSRAGAVADQAASYRAQLLALEESLPTLEARAVAGEDVAAALTWQRARISKLRGLLGAAA